MNRRFLASLGLSTLVFALSVVLIAPLTTAGQAQKAGAKAWSLPRTPDGKPDLQGFWTNNSYVPLERANNVTKEFYTKDEALAAAKRSAERESEQTVPGTTGDVHYDFTQFALDRSQTRLTENLRTSIIVEPANGKMPPVTAEGKRRADERAAARKQQGAQYDKVQNIVQGSRCIFQNAGPPMLPPGYNPAYQIVQGEGVVMILIENHHEARVIRTDGKATQAPSAVRAYLGNSVGRWEGDTLVVETTNFHENVAFRGASENMKVTERFTRVSDDEIKYEFTVNDPATWEIPWKGVMPFVKIGGPIFEHACHEGNYGIANTLSAVRLEEKKAAEEAAKKAGGKE
jgi:hypothetical protein